MKKTLLFIAIMASNMGLFAQNVEKTMYTTYDSQTNLFIANRMYQNLDGNVAVVSMISFDEANPGSDRGTGYNFYDGNKWGEIPASRVEANATGEDMRTGWPSIAPYGAQGEILVNHSGKGINYWIREKAGDGVWDGPHAIPNPDSEKFNVESDLNLAWPVIVTTGENNDVVHIFAVANGGNNELIQSYVRSTDLKNWDVNLSPLSQDNMHINVYNADTYAVSANGDNVAVVYCGALGAHAMLYKSEDGGLTWKGRTVWENPIYGYDWETDENSLFTNLYIPRQASIAVGPDGVVHLAFSVGLCSHTTLGTEYIPIYNSRTDGIAYWNDTEEKPFQSPKDDDPNNALKLWWDGEKDLTNFCAYVPDYIDASLVYDEWDYSLLFGGHSAYPSIAVDPAGNLALAFSAPDVNRKRKNYYVRGLYMVYKGVNDEEWSAPKIYNAKEYEEVTCVTAVSNPVKVNEFWFSFLSDYSQGFYSAQNASQSTVTKGEIDAFKFIPDECSNEVKTSVYPANAGVVVGAGVYAKDMNVNLMATPKAGYKFVSWTENGEVVSTDSKYSFAITNSRELVANFEVTESIEELTSLFNIYPNPVNDKLYIETLTQTQTLTVEIYDVYGRQQSMVNGQQSMVIDVTNLNSGVYFVKVVAENGEAVRRFIKK